MVKFVFLALPALWIAELSGCSKNENNNTGDVDAAESPEGDTGESLSPDVIGEGDVQETPRDLPQDPTEESDQPWGVVSPRCGDSLVRSCADCPEHPYVCNPCDLSANCVADCDAGCGGDVDCPGTGECMEPGVQCTTEIFCGCAPPLKDCTQGETVSCADNCTAECPGLPNNFYGVCSDFPEGLGGCLDGEGPEYFCQGYNPENNNGICTASCEACGSTYCLNESCSGQFCNSGYLADYPFYNCGKAYCCEEGFLCPATSACVSSCSECAEATAGACGENGVCVADCSECFTETTGELDIQVCDGRCADLFTDQWHCGACGQPCMGGMERAQCSKGHCCLGSFSDIPPWEWCDDCNCCLMLGFLCGPAACEYGCVN